MGVSRRGFVLPPDCLFWCSSFCFVTITSINYFFKADGRVVYVCVARWAVAFISRWLVHCFSHLMQRADSLEKTLVLGKMMAGGEGDDRGWDGWMASPTQWTWVWASSRGWWWTEKPGVLVRGVAKRQTWLSDWITTKAGSPPLWEHPNIVGTGKGVLWGCLPENMS